jgi:PTS system ascorbate-specific IIA component
MNTPPLQLRDLLQADQIAANVRAPDWRAAVRAAGELLVRSGAVEARYVEAMLRAAQELGPYIVIAPGLALPHARPEDGVLRAGVSVIRLEPPLAFGSAENDPVRVVIALAAPDADQHVLALSQLMDALAAPEDMRRLLVAQTREEIARVLLGER